MAQVRDTTINNSVGNIVKQGGGLPKSSASSLSIDKNKKRAFYRHYASGMLDEDRITDEGWKSIYEYQLENGLRTLDELDKSVLKKYNVDTSLAIKKSSVAPELEFATDEPVVEETKDASFISKLLGSLKPNNTTVTDRERNDKLRPITSEYGEASRKSISDLQEKINAPYNGVDMNSLIKDKDPLMMALNSKLGNASTSEQLGSLLDQYRNKTNISQNDGPSYLKGEVGKKDNIDANNNGGYMPKSPMVNPLAAHTTYQTFEYDGKIEPALHFKLGALNADIGREMTKRMYGQPNRVDDLVREYETLIQANPHLVESRLNQDTNFWNFVAAGIEGTGQQLGMQSTYWGEAGGAAATGAVLGGATALALGNLGPQALTGVDDAILLPTMMKKGAQLFAGAESFENMFQIEAGLSYKDMIEQGIDADTAKTWATVVGLINAGIEVNQIGDVIKTLPGAKDIIQGITKKGLEEATEKFVKRGYKDLAKDYVKFIFGETGQEVVQEIVPIVATEKAKGKTIHQSINALSTPENLNRLFDTATQSVATFVFMGLPGAGGNVISIKSNNKNVQSVFEHMDKVEKSVNGLSFRDFQGMDDDTKKTIFAYKGTLDTALKNKLFDEEGTAKAQALSDKIDSFIVNKSVGKEESKIIADKGHDAIYPTFKANLDGIDEARKLVETLDEADAAEVKETLDSFMADKRVTKLLEFFNGIDTKEPDGSINAKMAEFNEIYDEYFNPTDEVTVEDEMVQKPTMDKPVQIPSDVNNINQDQQVEDDTITPPQGNTSPETVSPDLEGYSDVEKQAVGNFMAETDKLYARMGGTPDQANTMRLATTMVDAIRNKDFKELQRRLDGNDDTLSKRMFTEITGLPTTNQDEAFESIRSLDPDAYDEYINSTEIKTPTKEEAEVKQDDKAIEREKKNKERYDSYAVKKIEYNGKVISMQEYADAIFAEGFRITNVNEYGGFELSNGKEKFLVNKWDKDKRWFIKKAFDKYLEKELAAEEKEEADRRAAMTQEERDAEDAAIDHLFGKDKKPKETPADESISDFDKEVEDAVVEEVDNEIKDDEAEKQVEEVEQHTPTKEATTEDTSEANTIGDRIFANSNPFNGATPYEKSKATPAQILSKKDMESGVMSFDGYHSEGYFILHESSMDKGLIARFEGSAKRNFKVENLTDVLTKTENDINYGVNGYLMPLLTQKQPISGKDINTVILYDPETFKTIVVQKKYYDYFVNNLGLQLTMSGGMFEPIGIYDNHKFVGVLLPVRTGYEMPTEQEIKAYLDGNLNPRTRVKEPFVTPDKTKTTEVKTEEPSNKKNTTIVKDEYNIVRVDVAEANLMPSAKPQGLYVSITDDVDDFKSPHAVDNDSIKYTGKVNPKNTLVVEDQKIKHNRFGRAGEGYGSAGVLALKELVGDDEFNKLANFNKKELIDILNKKYPGNDYSKYYDSYELLEAYAGLLARDKGYDSILLEDKELPELSELVVLNDDIIQIQPTNATQTEPTQTDATETKLSPIDIFVNMGDMLNDLTDVAGFEIYEELDKVVSDLSDLDKNTSKQKTVLKELNKIVGEDNSQTLLDAMISEVEYINNESDKGLNKFDHASRDIKITDIMSSLEKDLSDNYDIDSDFFFNNSRELIDLINDKYENINSENAQGLITSSKSRRELYEAIRDTLPGRDQFRTRMYNLIMNKAKQMAYGDTKSKTKTLADYGMSIEDVETSKGNKVLNVSGETKPYKDILKALGGNWYGKLSVWGYRKAKYPTVESLENAILAKIAELEGADNVEDTTTTTVANTPETGYTVDEMIGIVRDRLKDEAPDGWKNGHVIKERVVRSKIGDILEENGVPQEQQIEMAVEIFERLKKEKDITDLITEIANESAKDTKSGNVKADNIMFNDFAKEITENFREYVDNFKLNKLIEENDKNHHIGEINDLPNNSELQSKVLRLFTDLYGDDNALDLSEMLEEAVAKKIRKMQNSKQSPESPVTGTETSTANAKKRVNIFFDDLMEEMKDELSDLGLADEYEMDQIIELNGNIGIGAINDLATNYQQEIGIKNLLNRVFDGDVADRIYDLILSRVQQDNKNSTPDKSTQSEAKEPPKVNHEPSQYVADRVKEHLMNGEKFTYVNLFNYADKGYNGTQANHDYEVKDAYDGLELGVNQYLLEQDTIPIFYGVDQTDRKPEVAIEVLDQLTEMLDLVPTQSSKRTVEMEQYQQFSTPPNIAYVANWVADINPDDVMLEPSAGIGGLAVFAKAKGATVIVNELSPRRLEILKNMPFDGFYNENAEHIDNILPDDIRPTVVVMNPPFSATAGRTASNSTANAKMHLEQALERLEDGGRLVAIVGHTMGEDFPTFASWWKDIKSKYNVKANITIDGTNYKKYGTTYSVNLVVIDKNGPTANETLTGQYVNLADVIRALEGIKNDRYEARTRQVQQDADKPVRQGNNGKNGTGGRTGGTSSTGTNANSGGRSGTTNTGRAPISNNATDTDAIQTSDEATDPRRGAVDNTRNDEVSQRPDGRSDVSSGKSDVNSGNTGRSNEITLEQNTDKRVVDTENIDKIFSDYTPSKVKIKGAKPHKGKLSESTAMGAVLPPDPTYTPMIPEKIVNNGDLSDAQLEAIVYAGQSHEQLLPDESRRGFFIGDGTGVGKGREIAGIILDNYNHGRKKSVWVSVNQKLFPDAQRDIESMGMNKDHIFKLPKVGARITQEDGTLFVPYGTFKMNQEKSGLHQQEYSPNQPYKLDLSIRIEQMIDWLGHDFDGVIVFDESHKMANAVGMKGSRGKTKPSQTALAGLLLQSKLPKARVVYVSATGASEITNLAYLSRLGLWGDGTPFANVSEFINAISSGGLSAMELIARDMKAMGAYVARSLSYDDVTYERVEHQLNEHQHEAYGIMAHAWQIVMQNMEKALEDTNAPGQKAGNARGAFWGSQQRFFNQILLSDSMPTTLDHIEKDIKAGNTVVIQLTSTNEALMNRQVAKAQEEDMDYEDLDMSPRDILIEYLKKSFPVEQYEDYVDEYGNIRKRPVVDSNGKPVLNKAALRARDELIQEVAAINMPDAPIDMIINRFGTKNVAEITGRSKRLERTISSNGSEKVDLVNRTDAIRDKELDDFINDKRRILIFSQAGGTGKSYHASNDYKNNHKRVHYMLESGFNVMNAMQGLGRTHRTNQKSAPHVKLITTSVPGHKRFISTIARRFDQLGALTRGQREAASQGLFSEKDNLEGPTARDALRSFYELLARDKLEAHGLYSEEVLSKMGLTKYLLDQWGQLRSDAPELTDVRKFLNRLLVLDIDLQDKVFDVYSQILEQSVEQAIERGTLDVSLENFKAASVKLAEEITIRKDPRTGAETKIVTFDVKEDVPTISFDELDLEISNFKGFYKNTRSGIVRAYYVSKSVTDDSGRVESSYRAYEPEKGKVQRVRESELNKDTMEKVSLEEARELWDKQLKEVPKYKESQKNLITGVLLPIWDKVTNTDEKTRVMRIITDDGSEHLGLLIKEDRVDVILGRLNVKGTQKTYAAEDVYSGVFNDNKVAGLSNGWRIKRSRVAGDNRIELIGPDYSHLTYLRRIGVFPEVISNKTRYFIPTNKSQAIKIIEDIISTRTVTRLYSNSDEQKASFASTAGPMPKNVLSNEARKKTEPKGISDIIKDIERDFSIVITSKRYRNSRGASGFYRVHSEAIHVKVDNNINVISHELGHHLDKKYGLSDRYYAYIADMRDKLELSSAYKEEEIPGEVIAEFIRLYLTTDDKAKELSEDFYNAFMETIDKDDLKKLNKHKKDITDWFKSTMRDRVKSTQKSRTEKKEKVWSEEALKAEMYFFDDLAPIRALTETVEEMTGQKIKISDNPYVLALNTRRAGMIAKNIVLSGLTDAEGNIIGKSMKEVLSKIDREHMDDFDAYLKAKHAITLNDYDIRVFSDEFSMDEIIELVNEYEEEFPQFVETADELYQWWSTFIEEWVVKPGFMDDRTWEELQAKYPTYVPNSRVLDDTTRGMWAKRGFGNQHSPIKRIKGSAKDTYAVIESMMLYADKIVKVQKRNEVGQAIHKLYNTVEGLGDYLEKVAPETARNKYDARALKIHLMDSLAEEFEKGLSDADKAKVGVIRATGDYQKYIDFLKSKGFTADVIVDNTIDDIITYFTPKSFSTDETVFTVVDESGKSHFYYSKDPLFLEAMLNIDGRKMDDFVRLLGGMKRVFTTLTTGANPMFALFSNIWADVPEAMVYGDYKNPFEFGKALAKAMIDTGVHLQKQYRHKNTFDDTSKWGKEAKAYKAMGGGFSSQISDQRNLMAEMLNSVFPDRKKSSVKAMADYAIELIEQFNDTIETAPRLAIYNKAIAEYGDTYEGRLLAMYKASEATTNFLRRGKLHYTAIGQGTPFLNAGLQGLYKLNRELVRMKGVDKNDISVDGKRVKDTKTLRSVLTKALLYVTLFEISQMVAYDDDEDYDKLPEYTKDGYYLFKLGDGKFFKIRKPRALSVLFGSTFRRGFKSAFEGDEEAWKGFGEAFVNTVLPPNPVTDNIFSPLIQAYANKSWTGAPIVSKGMEYRKASDQYDSNTTELSKFVAKGLSDKFGVEIPPKKMDYVLQQYTGVIGQFAIPMMSKNKTVGGMLQQKMVADVAFSNDSISRFYDTKTSLDQAYSSYTSSGRVTKDFDPVKRYRYGQVADELSSLYDQIDAIKDNIGLTPAEKQSQEREIRKQMIEVTSEENLKPTAYDEFKVLYNRGQDITSKYKKQYEETGIKPNYTEDEAVLLNMYNIKVQDGRSELGYVNYQIGQIDKRIKEIEGKNTIPEAQKKTAIKKLEDTKTKLTDDYMAYYKKNYGIDIVDFFK